MNLGISEFNELWEAITMLEAQEVLLQLRISDWPHMKADARNKFHKSIYKQAYKQKTETKPMTPEQMNAFLLGKLNGR